MFETPDGTFDISSYSVEERDSFFKKYPNATRIVNRDYSMEETYTGFLPEETQTP